MFAWMAIVIVWVGCALGVLWGLKFADKTPNKGDHNNDYKDRVSDSQYAVRAWLGIAAILTVAFMVYGTIWQGANMQTETDVQARTSLLEKQRNYRDSIVKVVEDELSDEAIEALYDAATVEQVLIFLKDPSPLLLKRAEEIIALNKALGVAFYQIEAKRLGICRAGDNPFNPKMPWFPDCTVGDYENPAKAPD